MRRIATLWRDMRPSVAIACALAFCTAVAPLARANDSGRIRWKLLDMAQLKLDGKPPLKWSVYQPDKKKQSNLILVLLGHRYLALDTTAKTVYVVPLGNLQEEGKDLETDDVIEPSRKIPSSAWTMRDVGPAESIKMKLGDYGRVLEVQLPHMPDMRAFY
jgi:hypothetical protein